jgi:hypothetical protein
MTPAAIDELFTNPEAGCCLAEDISHELQCAGCPKEERALRAIIGGSYRPMTQAERDYCKREITSVEGYTEADAEGTDADVARTVLNAWRDYARDKGLL